MLSEWALVGVKAVGAELAADMIATGDISCRILTKLTVKVCAALCV